MARPLWSPRSYPIPISPPHMFLSDTALAAPRTFQARTFFVWCFPCWNIPCLVICKAHSLNSFRSSYTTFSARPSLTILCKIPCPLHPTYFSLFILFYYYYFFDGLQHYWHRMHWLLAYCLSLPSRMLTLWCALGLSLVHCCMLVPRMCLAHKNSQ